MATVLIVDDSPTEIHAYQQMLEKNGYKVEAATDGETSLQKAAELQPDVILMDVVMPGMNGFQATRQLNKTPETANIPVIIITTKDQETDRVWGLRQGARDYVVKPVKEEDLISRVQSCLNGSA
ncbi:MAG: response regulator [Halofilum sp. (in: g-proteobacteria)]